MKYQRMKDGGVVKPNNIYSSAIDRGFFNELGAVGSGIAEGITNFGEDALQYIAEGIGGALSGYDEGDLDFRGALTPDTLEEFNRELIEMGFGEAVEGGRIIGTFIDPLVLATYGPKTAALLYRAAKESPTLATAVRHLDKDYVDVYVQDVLDRRVAAGSGGARAATQRSLYILNPDGTVDEVIAEGYKGLAEKLGITPKQAEKARGNLPDGRKFSKTPDGFTDKDRKLVEDKTKVVEEIDPFSVTHESAKGSKVQWKKWGISPFDRDYLEQGIDEILRKEIDKYSTHGKYIPENTPMPVEFNAAAGWERGDGYSPFGQNQWYVDGQMKSKSGKVIFDEFQFVPGNWRATQEIGENAWPQIVELLEEYRSLGPEQYNALVRWAKGRSYQVFDSKFGPGAMNRRGRAYQEDLDNAAGRGTSSYYDLTPKRLKYLQRRADAGDKEATRELEDLLRQANLIGEEIDLENAREQIIKRLLDRIGPDRDLPGEAQKTLNFIRETLKNPRKDVPLDKLVMISRIADKLKAGNLDEETRELLTMVAGRESVHADTTLLPEFRPMKDGGVVRPLPAKNYKDGGVVCF